MSHWVRAQTTINVTKNVGKTTQRVEMVYGHNVKVRKAIRVAKDGSDVFLKACEIAGVKPTVRQRNKYNRGVGAAFKMRGQVEVTREGVVIDGVVRA